MGQSQGRNGPLLYIDLSVIYTRLKNVGLGRKKKKSKEKEQSLQCPKRVFCFTGKSQHHEAHSHPHQTALFPSAQKALGVVKRHIAALEKGTKNEIKQEVILDKTCFLKRLIFLSCISKYVFISCFVIKHFLRSTKDYTVNKKKKSVCCGGADSLPEICLSRFMGLKLCWGKTSSKNNMRMCIISIK